MSFVIGKALIFAQINSSFLPASILNLFLFVRRMSATPSKRKPSSSGKTRKAKKAKQEDDNSLNYTEDENYVFFCGKKCVFSQFHPAKFVEGNLTFNCMEQYMHYHKAVTFKDEQMQKQILASEDPLTHKKLGRKVSNFDQKVWGSRSLEVVKRGSKLKYNQNLEMKRILYGTHPKQLVEASPRDKLWGVGMGQTNEKIHDPKNWKGKNLLGKVLTETRDELMKEDGELDTGKVAKKNSDAKITVEEEKAGRSTSVTDQGSSTPHKKTEVVTLERFFERVTSKPSDEKTKGNVEEKRKKIVKSMEKKESDEPFKSKETKDKERIIVKQKETDESKSSKKRKRD